MNALTFAIFAALYAVIATALFTVPAFAALFIFFCVYSLFKTFTTHSASAAISVRRSPFGYAR